MLSMAPSPFLLAAILLPPLSYLISIFLTSRRFNTFAQSHNCEPVYRAQDHKWPWELDRIYAILTARKRGKDPMDDYFAPPLYEHPTLQRTTLGGKTIIETIEPANVKTILATKFDDWIVGEDRNDAFRPVQGTNIFTSDGAFWKHSRAMFRPQFARELVNDLETTEREIATLFEAVGPVDADGWTAMVDIKPLLFRFVLDTATKFLFGQSVESQRALMESKSGESLPGESGIGVGQVAGSNEFAKAFDLCSYYMVLRIRLQKFRFLGNSKIYRDAIATLRSVPNQILKQALQERRDGEQEKEKFDLLSALMEHTLNPEELESQTLGILFAGRDTTSSLLLWTVLLLGQHPEIYSKLRAIILQQFPQPPGAILDFTELKDCRYLQHVLLESLRVYQGVPLNSRVAVRDTVLPTGGGPEGKAPVAVKKGQQVVWNIYAMHRRKDLWGEDALEYKPERWEDPKRSRLLGGGWLYTPFSGGPRICLGQQYAMTEASYCLVRFVQRYDAIELDPESAAGRHEHVQKTIGVTLAPIELNLRLHEAQT